MVQKIENISNGMIELDMVYHLVIMENEAHSIETPESYLVGKVADCFVNPVLKDIKVCLRELCFGRPAEVQHILTEAIDKLKNVEQYF